MLKYLFTAILLSVSWARLQASTDQGHAKACRETEVRVNEVPLPRKYQLGVTWENITGFWINESRDESKRFIFDIGEVRVINRKKYFTVEMSDPGTGEVVRRGVVAIKDSMRASGIVTELDQEVAGRKTDDNFIIFRSFKEVDKTTGRPTNRTIFVVTIRTLREKVKVCEETHHELLRPQGSYE